MGFIGHIYDCINCNVDKRNIMIIALNTWFILLPIRMAFYRRWKGMAHSWGTQINRLLWGTSVGIEIFPICYVWGLPLWLAACCVLTAFLASIPGHASTQGNTIEDNEGMAYLTTMELFAILSPFYAWYVYLWVMPPAVFVMTLPLGLLGGLAYYLGYKMKGSLNLFGIQWCVPNDTGWGEFYTGALAFGLPLAIIGLMHH